MCTQREWHLQSQDSQSLFPLSKLSEITSSHAARSEDKPFIDCRGGKSLALQYCFQIKISMSKHDMGDSFRLTRRPTGGVNSVSRSVTRCRDYHGSMLLCWCIIWKRYPARFNVCNISLHISTCSEFNLHELAFSQLEKAVKTLWGRSEICCYRISCPDVGMRAQRGQLSRSMGDCCFHSIRTTLKLQSREGWFLVYKPHLKQWKSKFDLLQCLHRQLSCCSF